MSDILSEETIRLEEAARISKVHFSSAYRWVLRGVPGPSGTRVRLEAVRVGRAWVTSREALQRFSAALTPHLDDGSAPSPRTATARRRATELASARLAEIGI
jgi:hypothetical protein